MPKLLLPKPDPMPRLLMALPVHSWWGELRSPMQCYVSRSSKSQEDVVHSHPTTASVSWAAVPTTPSSSNKNHTCHEQVIQAHQFQNAPFC